jgi:Rrf2 family protein
MFSKSCEYAIKATIFIASKCGEGKKIGLKEIAESIDSPTAFTAKILQKLTKNKIINSTKGVNGGFEILKDNLNKIRLIQIVTAIDGNSVFLGCGLGLGNCSEDHPCPVHYKFKKVKEDLVSMLENTTLEELAEGVQSGSSFLKY